MKFRPKHKDGEQREVTFFAWLPCRTDDYRKNYGEVRWLEKVKVRQEYVFRIGWRNREFLP